MTQKEQLWENYEDAVFAILMDAVAEQEGEKGLQLMEELEHDPSAQVPEEVQRRAEKTIRKAFAAQSRRSARHVGFRMFQRIAVAVMIVILTAVCAFAAFPEVRAGILNVIAQEYEDHTDISFSTTSSNEYPAAEYDVELGWIPEGFTMTQDETEYSSALKLYEREDGATLSVVASSAEGRTTSVDTEDAKVTSVTIQGYDGTLVEKDDGQWVCIIFVVPEKNMMVCIDSEYIPVNQTIEVAENLLIN